MVMCTCTVDSFILDKTGEFEPGLQVTLSYQLDVDVTIVCTFMNNGNPFRST